MKGGFTLIEMLVAVGIVMVIGISTMVVLSNFTINQKLEGATDELVTNLKLARNYAQILQKPEGYTAVLDYVSVDIDSDGKTKIMPNSRGTSKYFDKPLSVDGVTVTVTGGNSAGGQIAFSVYEGKLIKLEFVGPGYSATLRGVGENVTLVVGVAGSSDHKTITINYLGQISVN
jgi:Tfp pilus assembly protein FimT